MSLVAVLLVSLIGSVHCIAMCGGFVTFYSAGQKRVVLSDVAYNLGRLTTYCTLGIIVGYLGQTLDSRGEILGFQRVSAILIGALMIIWGALLVFNVQLVDLPFKGKSYSYLFAKLVGQVKGEDRQASPVKVPFVIGLLSTFLPCGWLYTYLGVAAASGSPLFGGLTMFAFWLGTLPYLLSFARISSFLASLGIRNIPRVTAVLIIVAGIFSIFGRFELGVHSHQHHQIALP